MSDRDLRKLLDEVMQDIDAGRVVVRRPRRWAKLGAVLGPPALALSLTLSAGACDPDPVEAYGVPPADARVDTGVDAGPVIEYGVPQVDAGVDAGPVVDYGVPDVDAGVDAGPVVDYGVPDVDAGPMPEYGSP